uniref:CCHC-type domain-containing protein n=1 Tax=Cannabis sativa TaxID=3483 RepID=A0A803PWM1_CANSA
MVHEHFVDTILYGKETYTMDEVKIVLNSKDIKKRSEDGADINDEGLYVKGRYEKKEHKGNKNIHGKNANHQSKTKNKNTTGKTCYYCKKEAHFRDECTLLQKKLAKVEKEIAEAHVF